MDFYVDISKEYGGSSLLDEVERSTGYETNLGYWISNEPHHV